MLFISVKKDVFSFQSPSPLEFKWSDNFNVIMELSDLYPR